MAQQQHQNFGSIGQFKDFAKELAYYFKTRGDVDVPDELELRGTVKLHGTHGDIVVEFENGKQRSHWFQSRNRVLSRDADNCGFVAFMESIPLAVRTELIDAVAAAYSDVTASSDEIRSLMISGEFCGGDIQKRVALASLPKMFVIYAARINGAWQKNFADGGYRHIQAEQHGIYNISRAPAFSATLCTRNPERDFEKLKAITDAVERRCPFAETFGVSGTGEGVVWICEGVPRSSRFWFKVKGPMHMGSDIARVKVVRGKEQEGAREFARQAALLPRLEQGFDHLREMNLDPAAKESMGRYIKWVVEDVLKEEKDAIDELELPVPLLRKEITLLAREHYVLSAEGQPKSPT